MSDNNKSRTRVPSIQTEGLPRMAWTIPETAAMVGVHHRNIRAAIKNGSLPVCRIGPQTVRILQAQVLQWLMSCETTGPLGDLTGVEEGEDSEV